MVKFDLLKFYSKLEVFSFELLSHLLLLLVLSDHVFDFGVEFVVDVDILTQVNQPVGLLILDEHVCFYLHEWLESNALYLGLKIVVLFLELLYVVVFAGDLALSLGKFTL